MVHPQRIRSTDRTPLPARIYRQDVIPYSLVDEILAIPSQVSYV